MEQQSLLSLAPTAAGSGQMASAADVPPPPSETSSDQPRSTPSAMNSILSSIFSPRKELPDTPRARPQATPKATPKTSPKSSLVATPKPSPTKKQQVRAGRDSTGGPKAAASTPARKTSKGRPSSAVASRAGDGSAGKRGTAKPSTQKHSAGKRSTGRRSDARADDAASQLSPTPAAPKPTPRRAPKQQPGASAAAEGQERGQEQEQADEYAFKRFGKYRWAGSSIEIQVEWVQGDVTWEPEANLHQDAPESLFAYWKRQGGRPTNPADPDLYEIFAILKHTKDRKRLLVEWVGFGPKDATWVSRAAVEETAPSVAAEYWASVKPAAKRRPRRRQ